MHQLRTYKKATFLLPLRFSLAGKFHCIFQKIFYLKMVHFLKFIDVCFKLRFYISPTSFFPTFFFRIYFLRILSMSVFGTTFSSLFLTCLYKRRTLCKCSLYENHGAPNEKWEKPAYHTPYTLSSADIER
jgi:hypothetical protein